MKKQKNKKVLLILVLIVLVCILIFFIGRSFGFFKYVKEGNITNIITINGIEVEILNPENDSLNLENVYPVTDSEELTYTPFEFTITNTSSRSLNYSIMVVNDIEKQADCVLEDGTMCPELSTDYIRYSYKKNDGTYTEPRNLGDNGDVIDNGVIEGKETVTSSIIIWINGEAGNEIMNHYFYGKVIIVGSANTSENYEETLLNGADPVLTDNLVPVKIDDTGTVTKANTKEEWYSYNRKEWANAVILKDTSIAYEDNEVIPEDNIESYFVWIPKYSYQLWDLGDYSSLTSIDSTKPHAIPIKFGTTNTKDSITGECTTPMNEDGTQGLAGESGNCTVGDYMTHPAFLAFDTNGFWVGKFETGYDGATSTNEAQTSVNIVDTSKIIIKPNVYSWRNITVGNMFENSYQYLRSDESHMIKNTEWGAVAYLSHSVYGTCTSTTCSEVRINNNSSYITGYAGTEQPTLGYNDGTSIEGNRVESTSVATDGTYTVNYLNSSSNIASTTGNYTGIYDMSGGAWEYTMGYTTGATTEGGSSEITTLYEDFYTNSNYEKYYDKYSSTSNINYNNRILGDATGEMGPYDSMLDLDDVTRYRSSWYKDFAHFVDLSLPWFVRGSYWRGGSYSGAFAFSNSAGVIGSFISFRIVLAPQV